LCLMRPLLFGLFILSLPIHGDPSVLRFDIATFCCPCQPDDHFCQDQFEPLLYQDANHHYLAMGTDEHRSDIESSGNTLAIYNDNLDAGWPNMTAYAAVQQYVKTIYKNFNTTGPVPQWVCLNELSTDLWENNQTYRTWVGDWVANISALGFNPITYSPFSTPGYNAADWERLALYSYIAVENYISGYVIQQGGFSVFQCEQIYNSSVKSYNNVGVKKSRLILTEHFGQTLNGTNWGRSGVDSDSWIEAIQIRSQAAINLNFAGYSTYAWAFDEMLVSDTELELYEEVYGEMPLP